MLNLEIGVFFARPEGDGLEGTLGHDQMCRIGFAAQDTLGFAFLEETVEPGWTFHRFFVI